MSRKIIKETVIKELFFERLRVQVVGTFDTWSHSLHQRHNQEGRWQASGQAVAGGESNKQEDLAFWCTVLRLRVVNTEKHRDGRAGLVVETMSTSVRLVCVTCSERCVTVFLHAAVILFHTRGLFRCNNSRYYHTHSRKHLWHHAPLKPKQQRNVNIVSRATKALRSNLTYRRQSHSPR